MNAGIPVVATVFLVIGMTFNALGVIGILRFPDVYTRLHADTKCTTFGSIFTSAAVIVYGAGRLAETHDGQYIALILHTFLAVVVLTFTNAVGAHAIARAAHRSGTRPSPSVVDRFQEETES